jgi:hypothetical protein
MLIPWRNTKGRWVKARQAKPKETSREVSARSDYSRELLLLMARVLTLTGHSPGRLASQFYSICRGLKEPKHPWDPVSLQFVWDLPHVMARWHSDPQYLDSQGSPLALPLKGPGPSVTSLIQRVLPHADAEAVVEALRQVNGIRRRDGRYRPAGRQLALQHQRVIGWLHGLTLLLGLLRTVEHNIAHPEGATLLERAAINPSFPIRYLPEMHQRFKDRATSFLWQTDSQMRKREGPSDPGETVRLGLGIFAFEDPLTTGRAGRTPRGRASSAQTRIRRRARKR